MRYMCIIYMTKRFKDCLKENRDFGLWEISYNVKGIQETGKYMATKHLRDLHWAYYSSSDPSAVCYCDKDPVLFWENNELITEDN